MPILVIGEEVLTHNLLRHRVSINLVSAIFDALLEFAQFVLACVAGGQLLVLAVRRIKCRVVVWVNHVSHCRTIAVRMQFFARLRLAAMQLTERIVLGVLLLHSQQNPMHRAEGRGHQ